MSEAPLPPGYERRNAAGHDVVALHWAVNAIASAVTSHRTLHAWASAQPVRTPFRGRGIAWATELHAGVDADGVTPVVVRHSAHGGLLRSLTGDLFLRPTRAPRELAMSVALAERGVMTPELVGYVVYPALGILARADVMTRRLPQGHDFPAAWAAESTPRGRTAILDAVGTLLRALSNARAQHPDLNVKNIYIAGEGAARMAYVLDVDVVALDTGADAAGQNFARLARSIRKWNEQYALGVSDDALVRLASQAWVQES